MPSPVCPQGPARHMLRILSYWGPFLARGPGSCKLLPQEDPRGHQLASGMVMKHVHLPRNGCQDHSDATACTLGRKPKDDKRPLIWQQPSGSRDTYNYSSLLMTPLATGSNTVGVCDDAVFISLPKAISLTHTACQGMPKWVAKTPCLGLGDPKGPGMPTLVTPRMAPMSGEWMDFGR